MELAGSGFPRDGKMMKCLFLFLGGNEDLFNMINQTSSNKNPRKTKKKHKNKSKHKYEPNTKRKKQPKQKQPKKNVNWFQTVPEGEFLETEGVERRIYKFLRQEVGFFNFHFHVILLSCIQLFYQQIRIDLCNSERAFIVVLPSV